jgi:hypothetical protein
MDKTVIIVPAVVGFLGVLSALLGFIAEGANPYVSIRTTTLACSALVDIMHDLVDISVMLLPHHLDWRRADE